jgi:hypothetical protein
MERPVTTETAARPATAAPAMNGVDPITDATSQLHDCAVVQEEAGQTHGVCVGHCVVGSFTASWELVGHTHGAAVGQGVVVGRAEKHRKPCEN